MKKLHFLTLPCALFSTATRVLLLTASLALMANTTKTFAENSGSKYGLVNNIDELVGIDPSRAYLSLTGHIMPSDDKLLFIYNVGTKRFLSPGGKWGTQASLDNTAYALWLNEPSSNAGCFNIADNMGGSGNRNYLGNGSKSGDTEDLYMDCNRHNFVFEKAPDYTDKNKVYYLKMTHTNGNDYYVQANPDDNPDYHTLNLTKLTKDDAGYKN